MYRKRFSFTGLIAGILFLILIALGVLACIPETRSKMADFVADKFSPAYAEIKDENSKQAEQLSSCIINIDNLTTQRTTLLASVTAIDNKINSTIDSVELENLEVRKTAILSQIDSLNAQIETLRQEKENLQSQLDSASGNEYDFNIDYKFYEIRPINFQFKEADFGTDLSFMVYKSTFIDLVQNSQSVTKKAQYHFNYNGETLDNTFQIFEDGANASLDCVWKLYHNDALVEKGADLVNELTEDTPYQIKITLDLLKEYDEKDLSIFTLKYYLKVNLVDSALTGKFVAENGHYIDFDNKVTFGVFNETGETVDGQIFLNYNAYDRSYVLNQSNQELNIEISDNQNIITIDGQTYTKQITE